MKTNRLMFADFDNHLLPGMLDGPRCVPESVALLASLRQIGIYRILFTPTYRPFFESVRHFLLRRTEALHLMQGNLPGGLHYRVGATLALEPDCCATSEINRLALPDSDYLLLELPLPDFADWIDFELHLLLHKRGLKPVFSRFERCLLLYPPTISARLMTVPGAAYEFNFRSLSHPQVIQAIQHLCRIDKPVLLGTGAYRPGQSFSDLPDMLDLLRTKLSVPTYLTLLRRSFSFAAFSSATR